MAPGVVVTVKLRETDGSSEREGRVPLQSPVGCRQDAGARWLLGQPREATAGLECSVPTLNVLRLLHRPVNLRGGVLPSLGRRCCSRRRCRSGRWRLALSCCRHRRLFRDLLPHDEVGCAVGELLHEVPRLDPAHPRAVSAVDGDDLVPHLENFRLVGGATLGKECECERIIFDFTKWAHLSRVLTCKDFLYREWPVAER